MITKQTLKKKKKAKESYILIQSRYNVTSLSKRRGPVLTALPLKIGPPFYVLPKNPVTQIVTRHRN